MTYTEDPRLPLARSEPIRAVAEKLLIEGLRADGHELTGPCPVCLTGNDRFSINPAKGVFHCRVCGVGGDQIALVRFVMHCDLNEALDLLIGKRDVKIDPIEAEHRRVEYEKKKLAQDRYADQKRAEAISHARRIWKTAVPADGTAAQKYLRLRGIDLPVMPKCLRFIAEHQYFKSIDGKARMMHVGPAMIAGIQSPTDGGSAVHQTWIDLSQRGGKAHIIFEGKAQAAKLVRGSKKGGAIRLYTPADADTLIMGEGIETTLSALVAAPVAGAAYWAGVDLGNMSGRMARVYGQRWSGTPDMSDRDAFVPPAWVKRLIFIQDGDSTPAMTRAKLEAGLKRAMALRPGLRAQIVHPGVGIDLNDILTDGDAE